MSIRICHFLLIAFIIDGISFLPKVRGQENRGGIKVFTKGFASCSASFFDSVRDKFDISIKNNVFLMVLKSDYSDFSYFFSKAFKPQGVLSIEFSNFNNEKIKKMEGMFSSCENLKEIKGLADFDTSKITNMAYLFNGCKSLSSISISSFETSSVTNMNKMFFNCSSLLYLDISNFNLKNIISADDIFEGINNLEYLDISKVKNGIAYIRNSPFNHIDNLTICQNEEFINNPKTARKCCFWMIEKHMCFIP